MVKVAFQGMAYGRLGGSHLGADLITMSTLSKNVANLKLTAMVLWKVSKTSMTTYSSIFVDAKEMTKQREAN